MYKVEEALWEAMDRDMRVRLARHPENAGALNMVLRAQVNSDTAKITDSSDDEVLAIAELIYRTGDRLRIGGEIVTRGEDVLPIAVLQRQQDKPADPVRPVKRRASDFDGVHGDELVHRLRALATSPFMPFPSLFGKGLIAAADEIQQAQRTAAITCGAVMYWRDEAIKNSEALAAIQAHVDRFRKINATNHSEDDVADLIQWGIDLVALMNRLPAAPTSPEDASNGR